MKELFSLPIFGVTVTLLAYFFSGQIKKRFDYIIFNRVIVSSVIIIGILVLLNIDFEDYNKGANYISFFLGPSVVALGVFFYEKFEEMKQHLKVFLIAVFSGAIVGMLSVTVILILFSVPEVITRSLIAKSVTTPIAIEIAKITKGIPEITAGIVMITGVLGNAVGVYFLNLLGIHDKKAIGTALGVSAHGIGTARAFEVSHISGAYSGLAMCINGVITAMLAPYVLMWLLP
ncbi:LrgB family protein [Zunongwangia sp.]|uniref:LrgB family protein n=1 Tax=Zunongwangia sp. TaxID=1965325 RepID=UPI003AA89BF2